MKTLVVLCAAIAAVACKRAPKIDAEVAVECAGAETGYTCTAAHRSGPAAAKACWDLVVKCQNGTVTKGSGCQSVEPGGKASLFLPVEGLEKQADCDVPVAMNVENVVVVAR